MDNREEERFGVRGERGLDIGVIISVVHANLVIYYVHLFGCVVESKKELVGSF